LYEPEVPAEFREDRPAGPSKAALRAEAEQAVATYRKPIARAATASSTPSRRQASRSSSEPGITTAASTTPQDITITCQCGHSAVIHRAPADLIGRRLRCTACGEEPAPF
jgi:hypothetical protein